MNTFLEYNDYELIDYASSSEEAMDIIYKKYEPIIKNIAGRIYPYCKNNGVEINDLIQEGMIGLAKAIDTYECKKDVKFYTYAIKCIESSIYDYRAKTSRLKHKILNDSIPFEIDDNDGNKIILEPIIGRGLEEHLVKTEQRKTLIKKLDNQLTDFEKQVFKLKYKNYSYKEIMNILKKDKKSIDNALQRIKSKINGILKEEKS